MDRVRAGALLSCTISSDCYPERLSSPHVVDVLRVFGQTHKHGRKIDIRPESRVSDRFPQFVDETRRPDRAVIAVLHNKVHDYGDELGGSERVRHHGREGGMGGNR